MKAAVPAGDLFALNRKNFTNRLKNSSLALFFSNEEYTRSGDQRYTFKQNPDLFYLSGIDQEQTVLLLFPDCPNSLYKEVLFLRQTSAQIAVWEGHKYTLEEARAISGIASVFWISELWTIVHAVIHYAEHIYLDTNENDRYAAPFPGSGNRQVQEVLLRYPLHKFERAALITRDLRPVKSAPEVERIKRACAITRDAFVRVLKFIRSGVTEYEIEAEIIHEFIRQGATGHAYTPIIASGKNAIVLHYNDNNQVCREGDAILFDFGAEYANYTADMSRAVPVSGRFTARQRQVYDAVLRVLKAARAMLVAGTIWNDYHDEVGKIMESELIGLGLLDKTEVSRQDKKMPAYKKYFMHGTSHHLGIDVHDFASRYKAFEAGNILTCEPGIYIPEEGLGIRLENNILITAGGNVDLMADIPIEAEEIEELMNSRS